MVVVKVTKRHFGRTSAVLSSHYATLDEVWRDGSEGVCVFESAKKAKVWIDVKDRHQVYYCEYNEAFKPSYEIVEME